MVALGGHRPATESAFEWCLLGPRNGGRTVSCRHGVLSESHPLGEAVSGADSNSVSRLDASGTAAVDGLDALDSAGWHVRHGNSRLLPAGTHAGPAAIQSLSAADLVIGWPIVSA
mgnify:CR=1 FL=1